MCGSALLPSAIETQQATAVERPLREKEQDTDPLIGRSIIGQYVILSKLGQGGMGTVYLAVQRAIDRQAVIKVMNPQFSRDPERACRFEIEARAASRLNHPNIVTIYNYGSMEDGTLFLAMEYCEGETLKEALAGGPFPPEQALRIAVQICAALAAAHGHGVVHRDLKPGNIVLTQVDQDQSFVKVLDFGVAKISGLRITAQQAAVGTPKYMSPEQCRGDPIDGRADLYALGLVLHEMLTGRIPFHAETPTGYLEQHESQDLTLGALARVPRLPQRLNTVIARALAKDPGDRFASAAELQQELEVVLQAMEEREPGRPAPATSGTIAPPRKGRVAFVVGGLAFVVGVASWLVVWGLSGHQGRGPAEAPLAALDGPAAHVASAERPARDLSLVQDERPGDPALPPAPTGKPLRRVPKRAVTRRPKKTTVPSGGPPKGPPAPDGGGPSAPEPGPSLAELQARLERLIKNAKMPPSQIEDQLWHSRRGYKMLNETLKDAPPHRQDALKRYSLDTQIREMESPTYQWRSGERKPLSRLKEIYLSMETKDPLPIDVRRANIASAEKCEGVLQKKDCPFRQRMILLTWIRHWARDPDAELKR